MKVLVFVETDGDTPAEVSLQALTLARSIGEVEAAVMAGVEGSPAGALGRYGVRTVHLIDHPVLDDYAPEAWAEALRQLAEQRSADVVLAAGTERGNEALAHLAARLDLPMVAQVTEVVAQPGAWSVTRVRWGGSLLERCTVEAPMKILTVAPHTTAADPGAGDTGAAEIPFTPSLADKLARTKVKARVTLTEGTTLATAPVVVSGGRGMGSAENFMLLEELAALVGGAVGCSRVATNNGWRSHSDQVGQTGTKVAPDLYVACGISGAIQHWVGMMASKRVLAINTDGEAPMVTKSDYAVIGDVLEVVPAVIEEIKRRR